MNAECLSKNFQGKVKENVSHLCKKEVIESNVLTVRLMAAEKFADSMSSL
jgi:hypothetical protein